MRQKITDELAHYLTQRNQLNDKIEELRKELRKK